MCAPCTSLFLSISTAESLTGTSVQPLAKSLSRTMGRFTNTSPSSARMTRLGRQQLFPTSATVSCPNLCTMRSFLGSKCVSPPQPDDSQKLIVSWNPDYPPAHDEKITYKCNAGQPYNRHELVYICHPTLLTNRFVSDFSLDTYELTCQRDNLFSTPNWPSCAHSRTMFWTYTPWWSFKTFQISSAPIPFWLRPTT